jgi:hypothetical protein
MMIDSERFRAVPENYGGYISLDIDSGSAFLFSFYQKRES